MSLVKIDKEDYDRVLLTELLPYEVPMLFSNDGLYKISKSREFEDFFDQIKKLIPVKKYHFGVPFNYEVRKTASGDTRRLSIIHPLIQHEFIDFYKKYHSMIVHLCNKSSISLRRVLNVAKYFYTATSKHKEDDVRAEVVDATTDIWDGESRAPKSFFVYKPIDLIYKFYERHEYRRLEQRFDFLMVFDISKCFYNIYTHSIAWAVKDKKNAKRNPKKSGSFENDFDNLMQRANYKETNGIVVGPEVSRIFAEIILQKIDLNVLDILEKEKKKNGVDFEIRRYVDDYFVFSNNEGVLDLILTVFRRELEEYKLYVNEAKTEVKPTPFISNIAVGKREVNHLLDDWFDNLIVADEDSENSKEPVRKMVVKSPYSVSNNFIKDYQCIIKRNSLTYDILSKDVIRFLKRNLKEVLQENKLKLEENCIENFLLMILDIAFYSYSLNITSSSTFKLSVMIVQICKFLVKKSKDLMHSIYAKIFKEADFVMTIFQRKAKDNETNVETLNLLIALKMLGDNYLISEKKLIELFKLRKDEDYCKLNYFHIITLFYYIGNNIQYAEMKSKLEALSVKKFEEEHPFEKAELTLLFFDLLNCPFVSKKNKKKLVIESGYIGRGKNPNIIIDKVEELDSFFMNWNTDVDLEEVLKKKEWGTSY